MQSILEWIQFLKSNGEINGADAFGTKVSNYMEKFIDFDLGCCNGLTVNLIDREKKPITGVGYEVRQGRQVVKKGKTDLKGQTEKVVNISAHSSLTVWIERIEGGFKQIASLFKPDTDALLLLISPKAKLTTTLQTHHGSPGQYQPLKKTACELSKN